MQTWGGDQDRARRSRRRELTSKIGASVLAIALVLAVIGGTWSVLASEAPAQPGTTRTLEQDQEQIRVEVRTVPPDLGGPEQAEALQRAYEEYKSDPGVVAMRAAVGPEMSDEDLQGLTADINLMCVGGLSHADMVKRLQENPGLTAEVAGEVLKTNGDC